MVEAYELGVLHVEIKLLQYVIAFRTRDGKICQAKTVHC